MAAARLSSLTTLLSSCAERVRVVGSPAVDLCTWRGLMSRLPRQPGGCQGVGAQSDLAPVWPSGSWTPRMGRSLSHAEVGRQQIAAPNSPPPQISLRADSQPFSSHWAQVSPHCRGGRDRGPSRRKSREDQSPAPGAGTVPLQRKVAWRLPLLGSSLPSSCPSPQPLHCLGAF